MVKIRKNLVSTSVANKVTYTGVNSKTYLVIHETDNINKGANADAHGRLQANGNSRDASWHYTVDDKEVVQSFSDNTQCWAAGSATYNKQGIQIEICVNSDGDYKKAVENTVELVKYLMKKYNIPASRVVQHNTASGKNCPRHMRAGSKGVTWSQFKNSLTGASNVDVTPTSKWKTITGNWTGQTLGKWDHGKPVEQLQTKLKIKADGYYGDDTVAAVKAFQKKHKLTVDGLAGKQVYAKLKELEGGLSVSAEKRLQEQIDDLKELLTKKEDRASDVSKADKVHEDNWEWLIDEGISKGGNPFHSLSRQQFSTMLRRYHKKHIEIPSWVQNEIAENFDVFIPYLSKPERWEDDLLNGNVSASDLLRMFIMAFINKESKANE